MVTALADNKIKRILFMEFMSYFAVFLESEFNAILIDFGDHHFKGVLFRCDLLLIYVELKVKFSRNV